VEIPGAAFGRAAAYIITNAESSLLHLDRLRTRADDFDPDTRDRFLAGAILPASWYVRAQKVRRWYLDQVMEMFRDVDVVIAPRIGQKTMVLDGKEMLVRPNLGLFTQPISAIGLPVCAAPMAAEGDLPIGIQIIAAPWREDNCLRVARALEASGVSIAHLPRISEAVVHPSGS
jgi:aspartyl-tRNA(Asn)/glutamyl-tRNA(Gln) amidotransferase subunit A